jgi:hypothetical protein
VSLCRLQATDSNPSHTFHCLSCWRSCCCRIACFMDEWRRAVLTTDMHGINHHAVQTRSTRSPWTTVLNHGRLLRSRDYYCRISKAWKREYLLFAPPITDDGHIYTLSLTKTKKERCNFLCSNWRANGLPVHSCKRQTWSAGFQSFGDRTFIS